MSDDVIVFDLDGVIIDTQDLIRAAYLEAGVVAPDRILDQEGTNWLLEASGGNESQAVSTWIRKNEIYTRMIRNDALAPLLPPFAVACQLYLDGYKMHLMSAAPNDAIAALRDRLHVWPFIGYWGGLRTPDKMTMIALYQRNGSWPSGVYIDDQNKHIDLPDRWRFVRYVGQSTQRLYEDTVQTRYL